MKATLHTYTVKELCEGFKSDGYGGGQPRGTDNLVHILQQGEFVADGILQIPLFKHEEEPVLFQPPQQAVVGLGPVANIASFFPP